MALILACRVHDVLLHAARAFPDQFKYEFLRCAELRLTNVIAHIKAMTIPVYILFALFDVFAGHIQLAVFGASLLLHNKDRFCCAGYSNAADNLLKPRVGHL